MKSLTILIADEALTSLKENKYNLVIAKKVNDAYTVVWSSYQGYLSKNTATWTPQYSVFLAQKFEQGVLVDSSSKVQPIKPGQTCVFDKNGLLWPATGPVEGGTFKIDSDYVGAPHPAVSCTITDFSGKVVTTPIYVATNSIVKGQVQLTPIESVKVWFQQKIETSTMISEADSTAFEVTFTSDSTSATISYSKEQTWSKN